MRNLIAILIICFVSAIPCAARIIIVDDDGWADFTAVQPAIDDSNDGDVIVLFPGIYRGAANRNIDFKGKTVTLRSVWPEDDYIVAATVIDCEHAGRGFYFHSGEDANSVINGLTITNGYQASQPGGGIYCTNSSPTIAHCVIMENSASTGGGVACYTSSPTITNCDISGNSAGSGGGIYCVGSNPTISKCIINNNTSDYGGGIYCGGGVGYISVPTIINCIINNNTAVGGGGIYLSSSSSTTITNCTITGNTSSQGGGINCSGASSTVSNSIISCNTAGGSGGGIFSTFFITYSSLTITNCTFASNISPNGNALAESNSSININNCIFWDNGNEIYSRSAQVTYSNVKGGWVSEGNIDADPMFTRNPNDGGDGWGVGDNDDFGDLHLKTGSPCINAGDPNLFARGQTDIDGQPRIMGRRADMGADEFLIKMIFITKPQGKEIWAAGSNHIIAWESQHYTDDVDLLFSPDGGNNWEVIKNNILETGNYIWELPKNVDSNQCTISVVPSVPDANVVCVNSGLFTIHPDSTGPAVISLWKSLGGDFKRAGLSENIGPQLGCIKWKFETKAAFPSSATVGVDGRVHIACEDGKLYTLDSNGVLLWSFDANSPLISSPTIGTDGSTYVGSQDGKLYAIDINGKVRWTHKTGGPISSSPAVSPDGNVYLCSQDGRLYALAQNGSELWSFKTKGPGKVPTGSILASPTIGDDGTVYIGGLYDPNLYALDPNDGSIKWVCNFEYPINPIDPNSTKEGGWPYVSPVIAPDGTIYQTLLFDSNLYAIDSNDGSILWSTNLADPVSGWFDPNYAKDYGDADGWSEPAIGPNGTIYVSFDDPYLRAVDPNGSIKWIAPLGTPGGFTLTIDRNGLIYAVSDANLYVVDQSGWEVARFSENGWLNYPVIVADTTLIVADGKDYSMLITDANNTVWAISPNGCVDKPFELILLEDLNNDGNVNFVDLALFAANWLKCIDPAWPCQYKGQQKNIIGDVNRDRYVFFNDLEAIADRWLNDERWPRPLRPPGPLKPPTGWPLPPPPPKGRTCFPADTPVWVDGELVQISKVMAGQMVGKTNCLAVSLEQIEAVQEHKGTFQCRDIVLENGNTISVVDSHCFMLDCGHWIAVQDLSAGSKLKSLKGPISIKSITKRQTPFTGKVYNLKVKDSDRFFVGKDGLIVRDY